SPAAFRFDRCQGSVTLPKWRCRIAGQTWGSLRNDGGRTMIFPYCKTLLAVALAASFQSAFAGALVNDGLDGAWAVPSDSARGALFDALPREDGSADVFGAIYTYDADGMPLWLNFIANFQPGQSVVDNIEVVRYHGGSFGYPSDQ